MTLLQMNLAAGGMLLLCLVLRPLWKRLLPPWVLPLLWIPAALRLSIPWAVSSPWSLGNLFAAPGGPLPGGQSFAALPVPGAAAGGGPAPGGEPSLLFLCWLAGTVLSLGSFLLGYGRWRRRLGEAVPCGGFPARWLAEQPWRGRPVEILLSPHTAVPFGSGVLHPRILLPAGWDTLPSQELGYILAHEWSHLRRRDPLWKLAARLLLAVHWWNPLVWLGYRAFCRDLELACDQMALDRVGRQERASYALCLIRLAGRDRGAAAGLPFSHHPIEERIVSIMTTNHRSRLFLALAAALTLCAGLALGTSALPAPAGEGLPLSNEAASAELSLQSPVAEGCWVSLPYGEYAPGQFHDHLDLAPGQDSSREVTAAAAGTVTAAAWNDAWGNQVILDHGDGVQTVYSHLDSLAVAQGETVTAGQPIGQMGQSGQATGVHLAFGLLVDGQPANPQDYLE